MPEEKPIFIVKASGEREPFSEAKLARSLHRVKASPEVIGEIVADVRKRLKDGMKVSEIYRRAFAILYKHQPRPALGYSLKKAIFELGPDGYPFEKLVADLLKAEGYNVETDKIIPGYCVNHEVDVVATTDSKHILVEAKFHNRQGLKTDVKVALYILARFQDIEKKRQAEPENTRHYHETWLVTNTRLTSDAIQYAKCNGMIAIGWNYPPEGSLEQLMDKYGIYPVTCLTTLNHAEKKRLLENGVVTSREVSDNAGALRSAGVSASRTERVLGEIATLRERYNHNNQHPPGVSHSR